MVANFRPLWLMRRVGRDNRAFITLLRGLSGREADPEELNKPEADPRR
jgi:hypothetical protein